MCKELLKELDFGVLSPHAPLNPQLPSAQHCLYSAAVHGHVHRPIERQLSMQVSRAASRADRERARVAILREAAVVGSTLSFAGSSALAALGNHFDVVIVDEAAQAVEPSTLIPLVAGCRQVNACFRSCAGSARAF